MNELLQHKMKVVASYDGWQFDKTINGKDLYENSRSLRWIDDMAYNYDVNVLWPVAKRVFEYLNKITAEKYSTIIIDGNIMNCYSGDKYSSLRFAIKTANESFDCGILFNAVFEGIEAINQHVSEKQNSEPNDERSVATNAQ